MATDLRQAPRLQTVRPREIKSTISSATLFVIGAAALAGMFLVILVIGGVLIFGGSSSGGSSKASWTVELGTIQDGRGFDQAFKKKNINVDHNAGYLLGINGSIDERPSMKIPIAQRETKVNLVAVTPRGMDFKKRSTTNEIFAEAKRRGYELCTGEEGAQLLLQQNLPEGNRFIVAMEPYRTQSSRLMLALEYNNGYGRLTTVSVVTNEWKEDEQFVFKSK
jgi:hypothetical protein